MQRCVHRKRNAECSDALVAALQRTLRGCIFVIRAQPDDFAAPALVALELHLSNSA